MNIYVFELASAFILMIISVVNLYQYIKQIKRNRLPNNRKYNISKKRHF